MNGPLTLARKLDAVQRNTVARSNTIPTVCLHRAREGFLPSDHTLTWLAGDNMGLVEISTAGDAEDDTVGTLMAITNAGERSPWDSRWGKTIAII